MIKYLFAVLILVSSVGFCGEDVEPKDDDQETMIASEECFTDSCVGCIEDCLN